MTETLTLEVTTQVFGLGTPRMTEPIYIVLPQDTTTARTLIAEHVRAEVQRANSSRSTSLALHYLLTDNLQHSQPPSDPRTLDAEAEIARAYAGLAKRRYMLVVDGAPISNFDEPLAITDRSNVSFVRLLPLIGG